jgi:hypothetical protein
MGTTIGGTTPPKLTDIKIEELPNANESGATATNQPDKPKPDAKSEARDKEAIKQNSNDHRRQNDVRGSYVQQQLEKAYGNASPKAPDPNKYVPINGVPVKEQQSPATTFDRSKSAVGEAGRLSSKVEYNKLPDDLKSKMDQQIWHNLDERQRNTVVETYRRFKEYGIWDEVKSVVGGKGRGMQNAKIAGREFEVDGGTASVNFLAKDGDSLQKKLIATKHFGLDGPIMGSQHKGQKSNREWSATDNRSMHVSIGKNNKFDVHIDKNSPVAEPQHGKTKVDPIGAKKHGVEELFPSKIHNKVPLHPRGVGVDTTIDENREGWHGAEWKIGAKLEFRGPVKKTTRLDQSGPITPNVPDGMMEEISKRVDRAHIHFPTPIGMNPNEMPDPQALASRVAANMLDAARNGKTTINIYIPEYANEPGDQAKVMKYMEEIGNIVRSEMIAADPKLNSVIGINMSFGPVQRDSVRLK